VGGTMIMKIAAVWCVAWVLASSLPAWGKNAEPALTLSKGARVGVVNLLTPELTHYHASAAIQDSFLKTHAVQWTLDAMFMDAVKQRITQMGLEPVLVAPSPGLERGRQEFFIDGSVSKGLSKACADEFTQMASADHVDAFIVLAPGLNDSAHAGAGRRKDLPEYLRGWGFITKAQPGDKPTVFNMTQVLLVSGTGGTALLRAREPGGEYSDTWSTFTPPADLKDVPDAQLDTLKPIFSGLIGRQSSRVLDQIYVVGSP
jgi:hypothetical protein